jgi:hypothetical protein
VIAVVLRARPDIHLGRDGSETTVKRAAPDYRVVFFAPHGLVAGEGLAEPSLSLPQQPSELGDAPLTASEVTRLPTGWCSRKGRARPRLLSKRTSCPNFSFRPFKETTLSASGSRTAHERNLTTKAWRKRAELSEAKAAVRDEDT